MSARLVRWTLVAGALLAASGAAAQIVRPGAPGQPSHLITESEALAPARRPVQPVDVHFLQHMIVHHQQAVDMVALIRDHTQDRDVALIGERIGLSQATEIRLMRDWLAGHGQPLEMPMEGMGAMHMDGMAMDDDKRQAMAMPGVGDTPLMAGMLSPNQMKALAAARGPAFDRLFLEGMIRHHQGAIDMVDALFATPGGGEDPDVGRLAGDIIPTQRTEIGLMQRMLAGTAR